MFLFSLFLFDLIKTFSVRCVGGGGGKWIEKEYGYKTLQAKKLYIIQVSPIVLKI